MINGIIKMYSEQKGYGFISFVSSGTSLEAFFHVSSLINKTIIPKKGMKVSFLLEPLTIEDIALNHKQEAYNIVVSVPFKNTTSYYVQPVQSLPTLSKASSRPDFITLGSERIRLRSIIEYKLIEFDFKLTPPNSFCSFPCLCVRTQQDEYLYFNNAFFNAREKCRELDSYFTK